MNHWHQTVLPIAALALLASAGASADDHTCSASGSEGGLPVYRVGSGCACDTIQRAVNSISNHGSGIVRIRHGSYDESVAFSNKSVQLIGGHTSCTAAAPGEFGLSTINATGTDRPALGFWATSGPHELRLRNLNLANGTGNFGLFFPFPGGGLSVRTEAGRAVTVILDNSSVFDNSSEYQGGGISLDGDGDTTLVMRNNSRIFNNQVIGDDPHGGGLYCQGSHHIVMHGGSINSNIASSDGETNGLGGGVHLDGCSMVWLSHTSTGVASDDASLRNNTAYGSGGGLYATGGATVFLFGADDAGVGVEASSRPLRIHDNHAEGGWPGGLGGGIMATGAATSVIADRTWIHDNYANDRGGALQIEGGANVQVTRSSAVCHNRRNCSRIFNNSAHHSGAAAWVSGAGSELSIVRTIVSANRNLWALGGSFTASSGSAITLEDSLMHGNIRFGYAFTGFNNSQIRIRRSTIADIRPSGENAANFRLEGDDALFSILDSIVHETDDTPIVAVTGGNPSVSTDCVIWHDDALADLGSAFDTEIADPLFADRQKGLYYLQPESPAINYCQFAPPAPGVDLDWNPRGICHSTNESCGINVYDLGAYELQLGIFSDRFEVP